MGYGGKMKTQEETQELLISEIKYQGHNIAGTIDNVANAIEVLTKKLEELPSSHDLEKLTEQVNKIAERTGLD